MFDIAHVKTADAIHSSEVANHRRNVVIRIGAKRASAKTYRVRWGVVELYDLIKVVLTVCNARKSKNGPGRVIGVAGHYNTILFTGWNNTVQKVLIIGTQLVSRDGFISLQGGLQFSKTCRLPARKGKTVGILNGTAHDIQRTHGPQICFVKIQAVGAVFRYHFGKVGTEPVEYGHKIVDDHFYAML